MLKKKKPPSLPKNIKIGDILKVVWDDHFSNSRWRDIGDAVGDSPYTVESFGVYVGVNQKVNGLVIAQNHVLDTPTVSDTMTMLWPNIKSIERIRRAD